MTILTVFLAALELLLPGYAWLLVSGIHKRMSKLEQVVLSFVLSVCFSSLLAAALTFVTSDYLSLAVEISVVAAFLVIGVYVAKWPTLSWRPGGVQVSTGSRALDFTILA